MIDIKNENFLLEQKNKIIDEYLFMTTTDKSGKITDISQAYLDFTGYTKEEVIGQSHKIFRTTEIDKKVIKNLWDTILQDKVWEGELKNHKSTGEEYWIRIVIKPIYNIYDIKTGYISLKENVTAAKRLKEFSIRDPLTLLYNRTHFDFYIKKELNRAGFQEESVALLILEIDYYQEYKNKYTKENSYPLILNLSNALKKQLNREINTQELFKISEAEFAIVISAKDDLYISHYCKELLDLVEKLKIKNSESKISQYLSISIGAVNLNTKIHRITGSDLFNLADINLSKAKELGGNNFIIDINEDYFKNFKNIESITKLPNRNALVNDISLLKDEAMLIILHINQLNSLKDIYGFEFATNVMKKKSSELKEVLLEKECSLYNLNMQEFAVLVTDKNLFEKHFLLLKHSILMPYDSDAASAESYQLADFTAGISYGIQNIFNHANLVLQEAIISKVSYKTYRTNQSAKQLQEDNLNRLKVYKEALHAGKILPYFQPIVDSTSGSIIKYEALARIETEDGEIISPYHFLDSAKEDKTFEFFTRQMLQKVFNVYAKKNPCISINLTYENINSETMIDYIINRLEKYGGDGITFEILESEDILDYSIIESFILSVKKYGCKISIDDFGSGYSNFTNIIKLNIDYLKLDGSLIEKLNTDENVKHMIKGLLVYAKNADIKTIAEFVSTQELAETVKELGIDYIQGYYYGEPRPPEFYGLV